MRKKCSPVPVFAFRPNACVSVKLPIGVALRYSLAWRLTPSEPTWAVTALPRLSQPPPAAFVHACSRAVVLACERAVTVMTRVALWVRKPSGRDWPLVVFVGAVAVVAAGCAAALVRLAVAADVLVDGCRVGAGVLLDTSGVGVGAADVRATDRGALRVPWVVGYADDGRGGGVVADRVAPAARLIGRNTGRLGCAAATALLDDGGAGAGSRIAWLMPSVTPTQPATTADASDADTTRPADM